MTLHRILFLYLFMGWAAVAVQAQTDSTTLSIKKRGGIAMPIPRDTAAPLTDSLPPRLAPADSLSVVPGDSAQTPFIRRQGPVRRFFTKDYPNPRKAALMSLVIPGSGQAYNKKWWKIPIVYAGLGALTWLEINNINEFRRYRTNYVYLVDGDPNTVVTDPELVLQDRVTMRNNRDIARKNLEQSSLLLGLGYLLTVTDAFVDAHMASFDISDDLSMRFTPNSGGLPGVGLVITTKP